MIWFSDFRPFDKIASPSAANGHGDGEVGGRGKTVDAGADDLH